MSAGSGATRPDIVMAQNYQRLAERFLTDRRHQHVLNERLNVAPNSSQDARPTKECFATLGQG